MKRLLTALMLASALSLGLTGCWKGCTRTEPAATPEQAPDYSHNFIGSWELIGMVQDGEETVQEDLDELRSRGLVSYLDLVEDGTASFDLFGTIMEGTWEASSEDAGTMTIEEQPITLTLQGETLTLTQGSSTITLKKIDPADKVPHQDIASTLVTEGESAYYGGNTIDDLDDVVEIDTTIADDDICSIRAVALGMYEGDPGVLLEIKNKSDQDILVSDNGNDWSIDGSYYLVTLYETVRTNETLGSIAWFEADDVGASTDSIRGASGTICVLDAHDPTVEITRYEFTL